MFTIFCNILLKYLPFYNIYQDNLDIYLDEIEFVIVLAWFLWHFYIDLGFNLS